jgi:hypothetical protein
MNRIVLYELGVAVALLAGLVLALEAGYRLGKRVPADGGAQVGAVQGAVLGLLGLLLGFSFAGAAARYIEKQDLIVREANAIGTAHLRADLLDEPHRSALKEHLARYVEHRIALSRNLQLGLPPAALAEIAAFHRDIWSAARAGVEAKPAAIVAVLPPVNEVLDLNATRLSAGRRHLPTLVLLLLVLCSALAMAVIGYGSGRSAHRNLPITVSLAALISAALWITIDLDHPRAGLIRLEDTPLVELNLRGSP